MIVRRPILLALLLTLHFSGSLAAGASPTEEVGALVTRFCADCHRGEAAEAGLDLVALTEQLGDRRGLADTPGRQRDAWEGVVRKLRARQMPPLDAPRPSEEAYRQAQRSLESLLDDFATSHPDPGRTLAMRRLNRRQYQNAVRDLLAVSIDAAALLPKDDASHGFDHVELAELSPTLLGRYITAAQHVSRLAVGGAGPVAGRTVRLPADLTQEEHVEGLPLGTRGGMLLPHVFPQTGEYEVTLRLARDRNEEVEGLRGEHQVILLLDRREVARFTVRPPADNNHSLVDAHLHTRIPATAGEHRLGVTFLKQPSSLLVTKRQPYDARFNMHRHPRTSPALYQVSITGPYDPAGPGDTPSRRILDLDRPAPESLAEEVERAEAIFRKLLPRAYRRAIEDGDLAKPMRFFHQGRESGGFLGGIQLALASVLVSPEFLFQIERDPSDATAGAAYRVDEVQLASRLSFFLWSSIPDEPLLEDALGGRLRKPGVLRGHVRRMLEDPRAQSLVTDFAAQWLHLPNLDSFTPDLRRFPDFDDNLRRAFRRETELLVEDLWREDRSLLDLLRADYTHLNERLAKHYGIPHIYGSRFRRVELPPDSRRGGLLRHGSVLTVTSYATRTSPVLRGHWVLENLLGAAPPPPPPDVPALGDNTVDSELPIRQRLAAHRANEACAGCHNLMDPVGFALENYDAVGRWRELEAGRPVDARGSLLGGEPLEGVEGLERALLERPELLATGVSEKLLTYALGRGLRPADGPAVRSVVRHAAENDYRFSSLIMGVVDSTPFQMRSAR